MRGPADLSVSVVVGTYNGERHLREQLDSVLRQTLAPREVVVSDDGSSDGTADLVAQVAANAAVPVRWVDGPRRGFADNFLHGASHATSRFVAFCDQDDIWYPTKLSRAVRGMVTHDALVGAHVVDLVDELGSPVGRDAQGITRDAVTPALTGDPWQKYYGFSMVAERWLFDVVPAAERGADTYAPDAPLSHDRWLWFLGSSLGTSLVLEEPLAAYRQHGRQLYGGRQLGGGPARLRRRLRHYVHSARGAGEQAERLAAVCTYRSGLLEHGRAPDPDALARAAAHWRRLGELYAARAAMHSEPTLPSRLRAAARVMASGAYRARASGGLGPRTLVQDAGVLVSRHRGDSQP